MTDHSALIERLDGIATDNRDTLHPITLAAIQEASAALRDQRSKMQMMQARLDRWEPKPDAFSNWLIGRRRLPSAPDQAKALK